MSLADTLYTVLHISGFSFYLSLAFSGFMISAGLLDIPVHRSSHKGAIPTAGGVGIAAGLGGALLALSQFYPGFGNHILLAKTAGLGLLMAALGLWDDVFDIKTKLKFALVLGLCAAMVYVIGPPRVLPIFGMPLALPYTAGFFGALMWMFVTVNAVNFMDGANGMMAGVMAAAFAGLTIISVLAGANSAAILSAIMAAGLAGFLPYNARGSAYIFAGDVGALLTGFMFGACSLLLVRGGGDFSIVFIGPLLILPFIVDVLMTLIVRTKYGESPFSAHNHHIYQRAIKSGRTHLYVSGMYIRITIILAFLGILAIYFTALQSLSFVLLMTTVLSVIYMKLHRSLGAN